MPNINNAQLSGEIFTQPEFKEEAEISLTSETLSLVGPAKKGPAFVPQQVVSFAEDQSILNTWENIFGNFSEQDIKQTPLASRIWLDNNGEQLSYTRILGIGDANGKNKDDNYTDAGFVVGDNILSGSVTYGIKGSNPLSVDNGINGRTYFLGSIVTNRVKPTDSTVSPYKDYIDQLGFNDVEKLCVVTNIVLTNSGSLIRLQTDENDYLENVRNFLSSTAANTAVVSGSVVTKLDDPYIYIHGHKNKDKNVIIFPKDMIKRTVDSDTINFSEKYSLYRSHLNYASFNNLNSFNVLSGSVSNGTTTIDNKYFAITGSGEWNTFDSNNDTVNYECFESIYTKAKTPWVVSQPINKEELTDYKKEGLENKCKKLFRFHTYSDGEEGNRYRFKINPVKVSNDKETNESLKWSKFNISVYYFDINRNEYNKIFEFLNLDLNPNSEKYIGSVFGTEYEYYDLIAKKVVTKGNYRKTNNHVFVEIHEDVEYEKNNCNLIPCGFMPYPRLNINKNKLQTIDSSNPNIEVIQNPINFAKNILLSEVDDVISDDEDTINKIKLHDDVYWGVLFDKTEVVEFIHDIGGNKKFVFDKFVVNPENEFLPNHYYSKYFQNYKSANLKFWIEDLEDNNTDLHNNFFHLEKIRYINSDDTKKKWSYSYYQRDGREITNASIEYDLGYRYVDINSMLLSESLESSINSRFLSFDFFTYGGFDGINILDDYKRSFSGKSIIREYGQEVTGKTKGQTYYSYKEGHDLANNESNCRVDVLCLPGISTPDFNKYCIEKADDERRYSYLFDIPEYGSFNNSEDDSYPSYSLDFIKDDYYFENISLPADNRKDERDNISSYIIDATDNTINNFKNLFYRSKYAIGFLNTCEGHYQIDEDFFRIEIPPTISFINSLSLTETIGQPVDSVRSFPSFFSVNNILNKKFIYSNNEFDALTKTTKSTDFSINPISLLRVGNGIKTLSANTLHKKTDSMFILYHNVRIYNTIIREIRNLLFTVPLIGNSPALFNNFTAPFSTTDIKNEVQNLISGLLETFVVSGAIKNYFVDLDILNSALNNDSNKTENLLQGSVGISLFGKSDSNIVSINLDNVINRVKDFTEENNINIINVTL